MKDGQDIAYTDIRYSDKKDITNGVKNAQNTQNKHLFIIYYVES